MKKVVFINFGSVQFLHRQMLQLLSATYAGNANHVHGYQPRHLKKIGFYTSRPWASSSQKGFAFWSWKPFIIRHALERLNDNDLLIYSDIGRPWVRLFHHSLTSAETWLDELGQDVMPGVYIPYTGTIENWTKATTLNHMGATSPAILHSSPIQTSFSVWKKTPTSMDLANEWDELSAHRHLIGDDDAQTDTPNNPAFIDHRHDQAIFSILCHQRNLKALGSPSGQAVLPDDKNLDAWLQHQNAPEAAAYATASIDVLSSGMKMLENTLRSCFKK